MRKPVLAALFVAFSLAAFCQKSHDEAGLAELSRAQKLASASLDSALVVAASVEKRAEKSGDLDLRLRAKRAAGWMLEDQNRFDEAKKIYADALVLAEKSPAPSDLLNLWNDWAIVHKKAGDLQTARLFHLKTIERAEELGDWEQVENGQHGLGTLFSMMSDFESSARAYHRSIEAAEKWGNEKGVALSLQNLANIYWKAKNYPLAQETVQKAQLLAEKLGDSVRIAAVLKIAANVESAVGSPEEAQKMHEKALAFFEKMGKKPQASESLLALAELFLKANDPTRAAAALERAAALEAFFSPYSRALFSKLRGQLLAEKGQTAAAVAAFRASLEATKKFGFKEIARDARLEMARVFAAAGRADSAYAQALAADALGVEIFEDQKQKAMTEAAFTFGAARSDFEVERQKIEKMRARWALLNLAMGLVAMILALIFSDKVSQINRKARARAELLTKELNHRVKNNLQTITSMMRMQARQIENPTALAALNDSRMRLETISLLHLQLYRNEAQATVNMAVFCSELIEKLCFVHGLEGENVETLVRFEPAEMDVDRAMPLAIIVNELLTNSFKHAFSAAKKARIEVVFEKNRLEYADNGPGMETEKGSTSGSSFGLQLIGSLAKQLRGEHRFWRDGGLRFEMRLG